MRADDARDDERSADAAAGLRCRADPHPRPGGHGRRDRQGRGAGRVRPQVLHPAAVREPGQPGHPSRDHGRGDLERHRRHRSTSSSPASAPAAPSPGSARCSRSATRRSRSSRWSRPPRRSCPGAAKGPHPIQGIGAGFVPAILDTGVYDEVVAGRNDDAMATARRWRPRRGCSSASPPAPPSGPPLQVAKRPENAGQAHRGDHPELRRALPVARRCSPTWPTENGPAVSGRLLGRLRDRGLGAWGEMRRDVESVSSAIPRRATASRSLLTYPGLHAVWLHRVSQRAVAARARLPGRRCRRRARFLTGIEIHPGAASALGSSSTTGWASSSARPPRSDPT
jgi:hypothetical protein